MNPTLDVLVDQCLAKSFKNQVVQKPPEDAIQNIVKSLKDSEDEKSEISTGFTYSVENVTPAHPSTCGDNFFFDEDTSFGEFYDPAKSNFPCLSPLVSSIMDDISYSASFYPELGVANNQNVVISSPLDESKNLVDNNFQQQQQEAVFNTSTDVARVYANLDIQVHEEPNCGIQMQEDVVVLREEQKLVQANFNDYGSFELETTDSVEVEIPEGKNSRGRRSKKQHPEAKGSRSTANAGKKRVRKQKSVDKESDYYRQNRDKNNEAVKRCRRMKKQQTEKLKIENENLKAANEKLLAEIQRYKSFPTQFPCPSCNTTLSLDFAN